MALQESAKYRIGDKVRLVARPSKVGVILTEPRQQLGKFYYQIFFSATDKDTLYPEEAIARHEEIANFTAAFDRGNAAVMCGAHVGNPHF